MIAQVTGLKPGEFIHTLGDAHLYSNHLEQVEEQLARVPFPCPQLSINKDKDTIFNFSIGAFELIDYQTHPHIPAPIAV
jgi:thymidylate synthase